MGLIKLNLGTVLDIAISKHPDKIALIAGESHYKFSRLNLEVNKLASSMQKLGIRKGERVMVLLQNQVESVLIFFAVQKLGAIFVPLNYNLSINEVQYCINDIEPKIIFCDYDSFDYMDKIKLSSRPIFVSISSLGGDISFQELILRGAADFETTTSDDHEIAMILYTSGTNGVPKGVPRSHKNEYSSTITFINQNRYEPFETTLGVMPICHIRGIRMILAMIFLNGTYIIPPPFFDSMDLLNLISKEKVTCLFMNPTKYYELLNDPNIKDYDLSSLKTISYGGARMSEDLINNCIQLLKPESFINYYGCTEIFTIATCSVLEDRTGCVGKPGTQQKIRVVHPCRVNLSTPEDLVKRGEVGEIIVHIESIEAFSGYWKEPDWLENAIQDNWFFTGDLGYIDEDEHLFIVGRVDNMVISEGEKVFPDEIEEVLLNNPKVADALVLGEQDQHCGQIITAYIVPSDLTLTVQELDYYCKNHLSSYKRPRIYKILTEIPTMKTTIDQLHLLST
ncbi:class I adenylate-forming enzyme family protein [Bacillus canaveralius]|uniref:class I adenylate-forming enzyme family protein n=1 Tax=Bacillus canaveralius TaxID=1403243 RepID=UPI000F795F65|nr:class I adenylate-forming enzyme family protein [Bacillus canaveralius]RSK54691.1 long-chain fatty acid--CoA ligase [Bacillus canaveralius]